MYVRNRKSKTDISLIITHPQNLENDIREMHGILQEHSESFDCVNMNLMDDQTLNKVIFLETPIDELRTSLKLFNDNYDRLLDKL